MSNIVICTVPTTIKEYTYNNDLMTIFLTQKVDSKIEYKQLPLEKFIYRYVRNSEMICLWVSIRICLLHMVICIYLVKNLRESKILINVLSNNIIDSTCKVNLGNTLREAFRCFYEAKCTLGPPDHSPLCFQTFSY